MGARRPLAAPDRNPDRPDAGLHFGLFDPYFDRL